MFVKFYFGQQEKLDNKLIENGALYVTTDTNQVFADLNNSRIKLTNEADPLDTVANEEFLNCITGDASSIDNKNNDMFLFFNSNELEDLTIRTGFFYNVGAGWNTFTFPEPFEGKPIVICHCDGYNIEIKNVSETKFLYRLVKNVDSTLTNNTKTLYEYSGSSTSASYRYITNYKNGTQNTAFNVIASLDMSQEDSSVSEAIEISWLAIEQNYGW